MADLGFREFLGVLHRRGVRVWADGEALRVSAPSMEDDLRAELVARKPAILAFLKGEAIDEPAAAAVGTGPWFFRPRAVDGARIKLFCIPYACGAGSMFGAWPDALPSSVEVLGVQFPGRPPRAREEPLTDMTRTVELLGAAIKAEVYGAYALYGHSMGALIAFEVARWLRREGAGVPAHLFLAAHHGVGPTTDPLRLSDLPDGEFDIAWEALGGTPDQVMQDSELSKFYRPLLRADMAIRESHQYREEAALACPASAFGGLDDPQVSRAQLEDWHVHIDGPFDVRQFPGNHFVLETSAAALLDTIGQALERASC